MISNYQTFPITIYTTKSASGEIDPRGERLIRANSDGDITFTFTDDSTLELTVKEGFDCVYSSDVKNISSTAEIILS